MTVDIDLDKELFVALPTFIIGSGVTLDLFTVGALPLTDVLFTLGSVDFTIARIMAIAALLFIIINRDQSIRDTKGIDVWIVYATLGLVISPPFFPILENTLAQTPIAMLAFVGQTVGFLLASALN